MKLIVYFVSLITAAIGYFIGLEIRDAITVDALGNLTQLQIRNLIWGLVWFIICFVVFFVSKKLKEGWFGLLSLDFFLTWTFVSTGIIIGFLIYRLVEEGSLSVEFDEIKDTFFTILPIALGPTGCVSLGLRDDKD